MSECKQLLNAMQCGICFELLLDPVVGSCGHDFCKGCLESWRALQRQYGHGKVRCPVCRGEFAQSVDKLGVCVRLREMVELLFPDQIAARKAQRDRQAAHRKRSVERVQQEEVPAPAALGAGPNQGRRRLHARRHRQQQQQQLPVNPAAAAAAAAAAGGALSAAMLSSFAAGAAAAASPAASAATTHSPTLFSSFAANAFTAMTAAATQLQQFVHTAPGSGVPPGVSGGQQHQHQPAAGWPITDVQFTMGWFEPGRAVGRSSSSNSGRRTRAGRRRRQAT